MEAKEDVFEAMVAGKIRDIQALISQIENEIKERTDIDEKVLAEIQEEIMKVRNRLLEVEQFSGSVQSSHPFPRIDTLEKEVVALEGQKRFENVAFWRDLTSLRRELRIYMKELNDLIRKAKLVQNNVSGRGFAEKA